MNPDQRILVIGAYISSALYLTGCFVVSLFVQHGHGHGWKFALAAAGVSFLAYVAQVHAPSHRDPFIRKALVAVSNSLGLAAGIIVLLGG